MHPEPMTRAYIALGFAFDHPLHEDVGPLEAVLGLPIADSTLAEQVEVQSQTRGGKVTKATTFNWKRLASAITTGAATWIDIRRRVPAPERSHLELCAACAPSASLAEARRRSVEPSVPYRYEGTLLIGTDYLNGSGAVDRVMEEVLERWMSRIELRAGVAVAAPTLDEAGGVAGCSGGMPGSALFERSRRLWAARWTWGPFAREPEWGTYLTRAHADAIGGPDVISREVEPYRVLEANGVVFIQLTAYEEALRPVADERRGRLEVLMRPILDGALSRAG
jgi:hypothetical protein